MKEFVEVDLSKKEIEYLIELVGKQSVPDYELVDYLMGWLAKYKEGGKYTEKEYKEYCMELGR